MDDDDDDLYSFDDPVRSGDTPALSWVGPDPMNEFTRFFSVDVDIDEWAGCNDADGETVVAYVIYGQVAP